MKKKREGSRVQRDEVDRLRDEVESEGWYEGRVVPEIDGRVLEVREEPRGEEGQHRGLQGERRPELRADGRLDPDLPSKHETVADVWKGDDAPT